MLQVVLQLDPGGTERLVLDLVTRLRHQMPMAVCCLDDEGAWASQLTDLGVPVVALHRRPGFRPALAARIAALAAALDADVLHCHHYSPFVYGRLAVCLRPGCRVIYTEHGRLSDAPPSAKRRLANRLLMAGVDDLVAVSGDLRAHLLQEGVPPRMRVVWNGIDPGEPRSVASRDRARTLLGASAADQVLVSVARLDPVKDLATLVRATAAMQAAVPHVLLYVVGEGPELAALEQLAAAEGVGDRIRFLGHREDARALLDAADVYVNSSISEGISLTVLEAMAAGLPVVATRVGGTPEVVADGETGHLVPAREPAALAAAAAALLRDPGLAAAMGRAGRTRVEGHFTADRMVADYAAAYRRRTSDAR